MCVRYRVVGPRHRSLSNAINAFNDCGMVIIWPEVHVSGVTCIAPEPTRRHRSITVCGGGRMEQLTNETVELLQTMIRNQCVNDGTADQGKKNVTLTRW